MSTAHSHQDDCIEDNAFEPRPIHPDIHNTHFSRANSMRLMQCDTYLPFNSFGPCGGISDLSPSYTTSSSNHKTIAALALEAVKDSETTWLDQGKARHDQIDQEALRRGSSSWMVPLHAATRSSASLSNFNNTIMPCSDDGQEEDMVDMLDSDSIDTVATISSSCTKWRSINLDRQNKISPWLRDNIQRDTAILSKIRRTDIQRLEKHGLCYHRGDNLFGREPSGMMRSGVPGKTDPRSCPKPVRDKSLLPHLRDYVSQLSRLSIDESSASDALWRRAAASPLLQERLSPIPISPAQEARMIAEVPVNQSINLLQQPRASPKKATTRNTAFLSKEKSSLIPTFNQKDPLKTVEEEEDDAHVASPPRPPKDANKNHSGQEKPKLNLLSSKSKHTTRKVPRKVSAGSELLVKAGSSLPRDSEKHWKIECELLRHDQESRKHVQKDVTMEHLKKSMLKSDETQLKLQEWDKLHGLPKSHSQTMVNTSRSRRQLREGIIILKWDGTPLINDETELGKPKKRQRKEKH